MVAITVILAAVIGTFVLGLGEQLQQTTPQASFGFSTETVTVEDGGGNTSDITVVSVTHESGAEISETQIGVSVNGNAAYGLNNTGSGTDPQATDAWDDSGEDVSAGSSFDIYLYDSGSSIAPGSTIWLNSGGDGYASTGAAANAEELASGDTVRVVWSSDSGGNSATLGKFELP